MYAKDDEEDLEGKEKDTKLGPAVSGSGKYVAPGMRGDRPAITGGAERRSEENTCRVTNLPEECDEMVGSFFTSLNLNFMICIFF